MLLLVAKGQFVDLTGQFLEKLNVFAHVLVLFSIEDERDQSL